MFRYSKAVTSWIQLLQKNVYHCYIPQLMQNHYAEMTVRAARRQFLKKAVLNQNKVVIHAEARQPEDGVFKLKQAGLCPGVIRRISGKKEDEVDIILSGKTMKTKRMSPTYGLERVYIRVEGQEYNCILKNIMVNPIKNFIQQVELVEYQAGHPNRVSVPVMLTHLQNNNFFNMGFSYDFPVDKVSILCYNEEYPTRFYVDVSYVNPDRPYTVGDLANTFPPGVILAPKADPNAVIFSVKEQEGSLDDSSIDQIMSNLKTSTEDKKKATPAAGATGAAGGTTPAAGGASASGAATGAGQAAKKGK